MKLLRTAFALLVFTLSLYGNKVIYANYTEVPERVIKGQIFPVTIKLLSTVKEYDQISYILSDESGVTFLNTTPKRTQKGKFFYDTFYLLVTRQNATIPPVEIFLDAQQEYEHTVLPPQKLNVIALNPNQEFCGIIAHDFTLTNFKTTSYDQNHNIIVFSATAHGTNIEALQFQNVVKQGVESVTPSYDESKITYYIIVDKKLELFRFNYFNLEQNRFVSIKIPIVVDDDSVTTQSDLKPKDQSHEQIKMYIAFGVAALGFVLILVRKKYIYLVFIALPLGYALYIAAPQEEICVKKGAKIHLLPVDNGTIFKVTDTKRLFLKEGEVSNYTKVRLDNDKIGWIRNEDTCAH